MLSVKNLTLPQALVFIACLAAPIAAYKLLGSVEAGIVVGYVGMGINFLLGRGASPAPEASE